MEKGFNFTKEMNININILQKTGYSILKELSDAFQERRIPAICAFGTLLGFVRNNCFIEYDDDIDFMILDNGEWSWDNIETLLDDCGYIKYRYYMFNGQCTGQSYIKSGLIVDFFKAFYEDDNMNIYCYHRKEGKQYENTEDRSVYSCKFPKIRGFRETIIQDCKLLIPINADDILAAWYGETWFIPDRNYRRTQFNYYDMLGMSVHLFSINA